MRVAIQALAGVLGGTQSLHTDAYDEALALPTDRAALIALRTQQIIAEETGVANTVDPLGGSIHRITNRKDGAGALDYFRKIDSMGGMVAAIEKGFPQREIQDSAYQYQKAVERGDQVIVGVNKYAMEEEPPIPTLVIDESVRDHQVERLQQARAQTRCRGGGKRPRQTKAAAQKREHNARYDRSGARLRYAWRNLLGTPRRLRHLRRACFLTRKIGTYAVNDVSPNIPNRFLFPQFKCSSRLQLAAANNNFRTTRLFSGAGSFSAAVPRSAEFSQRKTAVVTYPIVTGLRPNILKRVPTLLSFKNIFDYSLSEYRNDAWLSELRLRRKS